MQNKKIRNIFLILLLIVFIAIVTVSGWFLFKYLNPTNKELLLLANVNTYKATQQIEKPTSFTKKTNITFETEGDFTNKNAAKAFATFGISLENRKTSEDSRSYDVVIDFLGNRLFESNAVKIGDTDVFTVPQLAEKSYASDSYSDVLSLLVGSERPQDIGFLENVDEEGFKKYYGKYLNKLYENIPDNDFVITKNGNNKNIVMKSDLNRLLYETLAQIKADKELRDFYYEQKKIVFDNVNKKIPYAGTLLTIESKDEYDEKFSEDIDKLINDIENSTITITAEIDKNRTLLQETIEIKNDSEIQLFIQYSEKNIVIINNDEGKTKFKLQIDTKKENDVVYKDVLTTFDINDLTKEKSEEQKLLTVKAETITDAANVTSVSFPEEYTDIRNMTESERGDITQTASKKFMEMIALLMLELI